MRILVVVLPMLLGGCVAVAKTAVDVVTLPVKAVSAGVDAVTTSQSEADEKRGRDMRKAEEEYGRKLREWEKQCIETQRSGYPCPPRPEFIAPPPRD
jgi:hypothetical protein